MIPKIIHFCWLSKDPYPKLISKCIESWKQTMPDYEIWLWDLERFPLEKSVWVKEAYESKKYAFAADYIRCFALFYYGGIYLDSDVEALRPFDDLLSNRYFMCRENSEGAIEAATIGAEKGLPIFKSMLDYYDHRHFRVDGHLDTTTIPSILGRFIKENYRIISIEQPNDFIDDKDVLCVYPKDYFSPLVDEELQYLSNRTYSIHHYTGTWQSPWHKWLRLFILKFFGKNAKGLASRIYQRLH